MPREQLLSIIQRPSFSSLVWSILPGPTIHVDSGFGSIWSLGKNQISSKPKKSCSRKPASSSCSEGSSNPLPRDLLPFNSAFSLEVFSKRDSGAKFLSRQVISAKAPLFDV